MLLVVCAVAALPWVGRFSLGGEVEPVAAEKVT